MRYNFFWGFCVFNGIFDNYTLFGIYKRKLKHSMDIIWGV